MRRLGSDGKLPVLPPIPTIDSVHASPARKKEREARAKVEKAVLYIAE